MDYFAVEFVPSMVLLQEQCEKSGHRTQNAACNRLHIAGIKCDQHLLPLLNYVMPLNALPHKFKPFITFAIFDPPKIHSETKHIIRIVSVAGWPVYNAVRVHSYAPFSDGGMCDHAIHRTFTHDHHHHIRESDQ